MNNEKLEEEILNELRKINIEYSIKKAPVYTLKECLSFYTKDKLFDIANEHREYISKSKKKAEMIELLEEILLKNIENDSTYLTDVEREITAKVIKRDNTDKINMQETIVFKRLGYIFWFYHNNEIQIVCPDEIADRYMIAYKEDNKEIVKMNNELSNYVKSLQHLYGVFEIEQLVVVWNKYNERKIDEKIANEFMDIVGTRQSYFWWDPPYIVSDYFFDVDEYEEFLETTLAKKYYLPTEKEIKYYMEEEFDIDNIYYKTMLKYFEKQDSLNEVQLDDLMLSIEISCIMNNSFEDIIDEINKSGFKFKDLNELNKFMKSYIDLSNNTRKWYLKGYKPVELSQTKPKNNVIQLKDHKISKKQKIGRNQPCPCGSGKKYKYCCGK